MGRSILGSIVIAAAAWLLVRSSSDAPTRDVDRSTLVVEEVGGASTAPGDAFDVRRSSTRAREVLRVEPPSTASSLEVSSSDTTIAVLDEDGAPIEGASVAVSSDDDRHRVAGVTSELGELGIVLRPGDESVVVSHPMKAHVDVPVPRPLPQRLEIVLSDGASIRGRVVSGMREPVAGARVIAWPNDYEQHRLTFRMSGWAFSDNPRMRSARSSFDGSFEIGSLDPTRRYHVFAASTGLVCANSPADVSAPSSGVTLSMSRLFAIQLRASQAACSSRHVRTIDETTFASLDADAIRLPLDVAPLAGLRVERPGASFDGATFLFRSSEDRDRTEVGPFRIVAAHPGCEPIVIEFNAPLAGDAIAEWPYSPAPRARGFGALEIDAVDCATTLGHAADEERDLLVLTSDAERIEVIVAGSAGAQAVDCLPVGRYAAVHRPASGMGERALGDVVIASDRIARLRIGCDELAGVRLRVRRPDGRPYRGHVPIDIGSGDLARGGPRRTHHVDLWSPNDGSDYLVRGLPPGSYQLFVNGPFVPEQAAMQNAIGWLGPIDLAAGEIVDIALHQAR